jgi:hypothetical protein
MAQKILIDDTLDKRLAEDGYVVLPFLNTDELKSLLSLFNNKVSGAHEGLYATAHAGEYDFKKQINDEMLKVFGRAVEQYFSNCRPLGGSYVVKYKGEKGVLFPHQDWNITDENHFRSFNVWVPLVNTSAENGAIAVLPHSHNLVKSYRASNLADPFMKINDYVWQFHKTLDLKAGEALIYDHRLLHASGINKTDEPRIAVVFGIIPQTAEMRYYYMNYDKGMVEEYESNVEFFFRNNILKGPADLKKLKEIPYQPDFLTEQDFQRLYFKNAEAGGNDNDVNEAKQPQLQKDGFIRRILNAIGI